MFTPTGSRGKWSGAGVAEVFRKEGCYPVKPENPTIAENGGEGVRATIHEIEYQGMEMRMMLRNRADEGMLEIRYRGEKEYRTGDEVTLTV